MKPGEDGIATPRLITAVTKTASTSESSIPRAGDEPGRQCPRPPDGEAEAAEPECAGARAGRRGPRRCPARPGAAAPAAALAGPTADVDTRADEDERDGDQEREPAAAIRRPLRAGHERQRHGEEGDERDDVEHTVEEHRRERAPAGDARRDLASGRGGDPRRDPEDVVDRDAAHDHLREAPGETEGVRAIARQRTALAEVHAADRRDRERDEREVQSPSTDRTSSTSALRTASQSCRTAALRPRGRRGSRLRSTALIAGCGVGASTRRGSQGLGLPWR